LRAPAGAPARPSGADLAGRLKAVGTLIGLLVYALGLEPLGFLLATFALLLFFFTALQRQRWPVAVGGSLATALLTYLVFKVWLGVNLPGGLWSF
jgi:putative tricarboxylic transport membrane protein